MYNANTEQGARNSAGPFVLPCTVRTRPLGQNTESYVKKISQGLDTEQVINMVTVKSPFNKTVIFVFEILMKEIAYGGISYEVRISFYFYSLYSVHCTVQRFIRFC